MDRTREVAIVLALLELVPGDPSDLTVLLQDAETRSLLLEGADSRNNAGRRPIVEYLAENLDLGRVENWAKVVERGVRDGHYQAILAGSPEYPTRLEGLPDAPPILFRSKNEAVATSVLNGPTLAIVGARNASASTLLAANAVAAATAAAGAHIISGLATGIDTAAHIGALEAGGLTTAVMGTGIEHVFPSENIAVAARIAQRGMLLSQFAPTAPRTGTTFLRRNAVIAGLCDTSLVMDARERSGSHDELSHAMRYGRCVLLWRPSMYKEAWAQALAFSGAASFVESAEEVLERLG